MHNTDLSGMHSESSDFIHVALAGNPNVGKSTLFNALTGMKQHTGNWPGKTVGIASGTFKHRDRIFKAVDLPGTYSLSAVSEDETVAGEYICSGAADIIVAVSDACCIERNLNLILQIRHLTPDLIVCINLLDEAEKKGIKIDLELLSKMLKCPVIGTVAKSRHDINALKDLIYRSSFNIKGRSGSAEASKRAEKQALCNISGSPEDHVARAKEICCACVSGRTDDTDLSDRKIDRVVTSAKYGFPLMLALLALIFWITITGANYPSVLLSDLFIKLGSPLRNFLYSVHMPAALTGMIVDGIYGMLSRVISVMLPPMAIFFPMFTLLEDFGYLPRVAFNMDNIFRKAGTCGKQCLTMMMGFGCNACGVTGCRIIQSEREKLIAILTNSFTPCNGKFPTIIAIISMFFAFSGSFWSVLILTGLVILSVFVTLLVSMILSRTFLKGISSSFMLELPPYRVPRAGEVIIRSVIDRTLKILMRAVYAAAPAGLLIWLLGNIKAGDANILTVITEYLDGFGNMLGVDGVIITAFILGFPANETVIPIMLMLYSMSGTMVDFGSLTELYSILAANGWNITTAVCTVLMTLFHFPCATTILTIKKETGSIKWTLLAFLLPTLTGMILCFMVNFLMSSLLLI